jgi:hypothetical protein
MLPVAQACLLAHFYRYEERFSTLCNMSVSFIMLGRHAEALDCLQQCVSLHKWLNRPIGADLLARLAEAHAWNKKPAAVG